MAAASSPILGSSYSRKSTGGKDWSIVFNSDSLVFVRYAFCVDGLDVSVGNNINK